MNGTIVAGEKGKTMSKYIKQDDVFELARTGVLVSNGSFESVCKYIGSLPTIEVSEDCISREWLIKALDNLDWYDFDMFYKVVENAPSVVPSRAEGKWFLDGRCSECLASPLTSHKNYCPNCGAKMKG